MLRRLLLLLIFLTPVSVWSQTTNVQGTIVDPNGNPYGNGTASAFKVVASGQNPGPSLTVTTSAAGFFTFSGANILSSPASYQFTICAAPLLLGQPTVNPTPKQVCFISAPIAISGASQDISATLNAIAPVLGPQGQGTNPNFTNLNVTGTLTVPAPSNCANSVSIGVGTTLGANCTNSTGTGAWTVGGNLAVSGTGTFPNINNIRLVDGVVYTTIQAAITACPGATTQCTIIVPNTYAGADPVACPAVNITVWDLRSQTFSSNPVHYGFNVWDGCPNSKWGNVNTGGLARAKHYIGYTAASNASPGETAETVVMNVTANQWPVSGASGNVQEALATVTQVNTGTDTLTNASTNFPNTISTHEFFASPVGTGLLINDIRASTGSISSGSGSGQIGYASVYDAVVGPLLAGHHVLHYVGHKGNDPFAGGIPTLSFSGNLTATNGQTAISWVSGDKFAPNSMPTFPIVIGGTTFIISSCASSIACTLSANFTGTTGTNAYTFAGYAYGVECIGSCRLSAVSAGTNTDPHGGGGNLFDTAAGGSATTNKNWFRDTSSQLADGTYDRGSFEFHGTASGNACFDGSSGWVWQSRTPTKVACLNAAGTMMAGVYCNATNGTGCISPPTSGTLSSPVAAGTGRVAQIIASGTSAMGTGAIAATTCAAAVTTTATGAASTDSIEWAFNAAPPSGYAGASPAAGLHILQYITSGNVNFQVCNPTAASITPAAATLNWSVIR